MARDGRKKTAKSSTFQKGKPEDKKSFWSYFFEPVPEDEDDDFYLDAFDDGRQYGEPPDDEPPAPLFDDAELVYSAAKDAAAAAGLTWSDGERVVADVVYPAGTASEDFDAYLQGAAQTPANPYVPLGTPPQVPVNPYVPPGAPPQSTTNPYVPLGAPPQAPVNPYVPPGAPPQVPVNPYVPPGVSPQAPVNPYVPPSAPGTAYAPAEQPARRAGTAYAPPQEPPYIPPQDADDDAYDDAPLYASAEDIRLFDEVTDAEDVSARERGQTTRLFRTGTGATTRIHINETEDAIRMEEAARRARAREARIKHEAAMERQNKRKKRNALLKKLFANIAFVLFFIVAIIVALYYGFLLSDIIVLGNDTYPSEAIVALSELELGTHVLFCNLDEAAANIRQDPVLQVEQINYIFPSRIRIVVSERKEVACIIGLDYNIIIDDKGYVLSMSDGTDTSRLLQVTGVSTAGFQLGQLLGEGNDLGTATLVQIIAKLEEYQLMNAVKSIDMTTPLAITFTASNGLNVHLGQATDLDNKLSTFSRLLPQFVSQNIYEGTLYLSAKGGAVYSPAGAARAAAAAAGDMPDEPTPDDAPIPDGEDQGATPAEGGDGATPGDGADIPAVTPPPPTPSPYNPGGSSDEFQG